MPKVASLSLPCPRLLAPTCNAKPAREGRPEAPAPHSGRARPAGALQSDERHCVKVLTPSSAVRALVGAVLVVVVSMTVSLSAPAPASAITRQRIIKRANYWVKKRVPYSQSRTYRGYRRDCSGFVSMSWKLGKSYSTRTISKRAKRIKVSSLKPGDAVLIPGRHVSIFGGWKNKRKRTYYALEQTTWGSHAKKRVRKIPHGARALRRKGVTVPKRRIYVAAKPRPSLAATPAAATVATPSAEPTTAAPPTSEPTSASVEPTTAASAATNGVGQFFAELLQ